MDVNEQLRIMNAYKSLVFHQLPTFLSDEEAVSVLVGPMRGEDDGTDEAS